MIKRRQRASATAKRRRDYSSTSLRRRGRGRVRGGALFADREVGSGAAAPAAPPAPLANRVFDTDVTTDNGRTTHAVRFVTPQTLALRSASQLRVPAFRAKDMRRGADHAPRDLEVRVGAKYVNDFLITGDGTWYASLRALLLPGIIGNMLSTTQFARLAPGTFELDPTTNMLLVARANRATEIASKSWGILAPRADRKAILLDPAQWAVVDKHTDPMYFVLRRWRNEQELGAAVKYEGIDMAAEEVLDDVL